MAIGIGVNAWVWTSPFTTQDGPDGLGLMDKVKQMGFDSFEFGLEDTSHVDPQKLKDKAQQTGLWHIAPDGTELERVAPAQEPHYDF